MQVHKSSTRISKTRILPARVQKKQFSMPLSNRYFAKISHERSIMGQSLQRSQAKLSSSLKSSGVIDRSFSLQVRRKDSIVRERIQVSQSQRNLPEIKGRQKKQKSRGAVEPVEIINSELGTLSFNMIVGLREQMESSRVEYGRKSLLRANSITSEELSAEGEEEKSQVDRQGEEKSYEEYDRLLMTREPAFYRPKRFNLKHKAEWFIPSCSKT